MNENNTNIKHRKKYTLQALRSHRINYFILLSEIREKCQGFSGNSATLICRLCVSLQVSHIQVNGSELQYQTQPLEICGAVFGKITEYFLISDKNFSMCKIGYIRLPGEMFYTKGNIMILFFGEMFHDYCCP